MKQKYTSITLQKLAKNNNQRAARLRRQRGYHWEDTIVKRFNKKRGWRAFRLGSPSIALPDVLAVNTQKSIIYAIEAKSGTSTSLYVPSDQIERCLDWTKTFDIYKDNKVILAFKFLSKKRIDIGVYESRKLREFYIIWDNTIPPTDCTCTYDGVIHVRKGGKKKELHLQECKMPFKTKQIHT